MTKSGKDVLGWVRWGGGGVKDWHSAVIPSSDMCPGHTSCKDISDALYKVRPDPPLIYDCWKVIQSWQPLLCVTYEVPLPCHGPRRCRLHLLCIKLIQTSFVLVSSMTWAAICRWSQWLSGWESACRWSASLWCQCRVYWCGSARAPPGPVRLTPGQDRRPSGSNHTNKTGLFTEHIKAPFSFAAIWDDPCVKAGNG